MGYNYYLPQQYYAGGQMPYNATGFQPNAQQAQGNQITWVQGEAAAKAYPVGAGQSVLLMDSEDSVMYIKSTDQSGMPQPLRIFDYKERNATHNNAPATNIPDIEYVSRTEFEEFRDDVKRAIKGIRKPNIEDGEG